MVPIGMNRFLQDAVKDMLTGGAEVALIKVGGKMMIHYK